MYILGGKLKGRKLANYKTRSIRPAMALVRKSIFDTISNHIQGAKVLDLFSGSGVLGIESLSRGAKELTLIDSNKDAIRLINKNLEICNLEAKVIFGELPKILHKKQILAQEFDLIFIDPPYGSCNVIENILEIITSNKILAKSGLISIESETKSKFLIPHPLKIYREKKFGSTRVYLLYAS
ncbi:MAG: 16S rRNA (guanine(966)-N(2))-methyltransferase RsmD [Candidatus Melainabacteria bacterium]|nr:16S rRNA (guanine(966)-N(2))-methyltransferase RsmD [Candidatus Melainabacteria bacterium]